MAFHTASKQFRPERWNNAFEQSLPKGVYFPFGDGPRSCIGKGFAVMEAVLVLVAIAQKFRLDLPPNYRTELQASITLRPKHGMKMCLKER
jgi:cytochrome P450